MQAIWNNGVSECSSAVVTIISTPHATKNRILQSWQKVWAEETMIMNLCKDANKRALSDSPALPQPRDAIIIITMIIVIEAAQLLIFQLSQCCIKSPIVSST